MRLVPISIALLGLAALAGVAAQPRPAVTQDMNPSPSMKIQSDTDKIIAVVQQVATAMERGDLAAALATYEPSAHLVIQPGQSVTGPALGAALQGFIAMKPKFSMTRHDVVVSGDIALHISPWSMEATDPANGAAIKGGGLSLAVLRRQADGRWLMVMDDPYGGAVLAPTNN